MELLLLCLAIDASSLKEFMDAAEINNIDRQISRGQTVVAERNLQQSWTGLLPVATATGGYTYNQAEAVVAVADPLQGISIVNNPDGTQTGLFNAIYQIPIQLHHQLSATVSASLPLIDWGRWMKISQAKAALAATEARDTANRDLMRKAIVTAYYSYVAACAVVQSAERSHGVAKSQLALQSARAAAGSVTQLDRLRSEAEMESRAQVLAGNLSLAAQAKRTLRTLTGLEPDDFISMPPENQAVEPHYKQLEERAQNVPALKATQQEAVAAERIAAQIAYSQLPTVNAQFTEQISNATSFTGVATQFTTGVTLNWRFDVQSWMGLPAQKAQAQVARMIAEKTRLAAVDAIHNDWQRFNAALTNVKAARTQVAAARSASEVAHNRYVAGVMSQIEVISAERDLFAAEVAQIQAGAELATARLLLHISATLPLGL
ncbi:MAG: TolC family protein [Deltaproteobacteria bacterium]|nr:TolC family protein [Deltaproteobacteria bacterium]